MCQRAIVGLLSCLAASNVPAAFAAPEAPASGLKIFISVDMEGVAGVVTADQLGPQGFEYERFRRFMTDEAVAAVRAAKDAGATEVVVADSHGNGESLLIEEFPKDVRIVRSWPRHGGMMAGLDASFGAALFVGYHASTTNPKGCSYDLQRLLHARRLERRCGNRGRVQCRLCGCLRSPGSLCLGR